MTLGIWTSRIALIAAMILGLGGCALKFPGLKPAGPVVAQPDAQQVKPVPRPEQGAAAPDENARTVEQFDTTSAAEREAAADAAPAERPERELGKTIAALGNPAETGFWAKTPLVKDAQQGRLVYATNGNSVLVELRPLEGAVGAGSQVSLAAMRILAAPLTGLPELIVYAR